MVWEETMNYLAALAITCAFISVVAVAIHYEPRILAWFCRKRSKRPPPHTRSAMGERDYT